MARPKQGYILNGEPVVGTTTVCGLLAKPALVGWAGKLCSEVAWRAGRNGDPLPKWTEVLYPVRDAAAEAGSLVHDMFEAHLRGHSIPIPDDSPVGQAAERGFENALAWLDSSGLKVEAFEKPLISREFLFGGTPDAIGRTKAGQYVLLDWKTSRQVYVEMILQMAAYRHLLFECENIRVIGCHLVRFSREYGDFSHHFYGEDCLAQGWQIFRNLLAIYQPLKDLERRVG